MCLAENGGHFQHLIAASAVGAWSRVTQHSVLRVLTQDQRYDRMTICGDLIGSADDELMIITGDEIWCFLYDPQLKRQSPTWKSGLSPRRKKLRRDRSKGTVMIERFFDSLEIIHMEFISNGEPEMSQFEQRANIKFCQKLGKTAAETFQMMQQVYGEDAVSRSVVFRWHRRFLQGRDSLEDDVRTGRPQTIPTERKIQEVATLVRANRSHSVDDTAATVGVSHGTCYKILSDDLNMYRVTQHSVPRILSQDQRDDRMTICGDFISSADDDPTFLNRIITGDETWCFLYDPQLKRQSATWKTPLSPGQKKPRQDR
ncbi:hypothetical protein ANN_19090 [Periplaneta americana]|uniref:Mos1 transposase HTH domain-containing protein n=1 Tax=Periplaneta americana TaxID=6978 RepID=A0ABQ8SRY4_PERAM|nr:hypothetical protein ANN_19090 [Periplaneta americana]